MDKGSVSLLQEEEDRVKSRGKGHVRSDPEGKQKAGRREVDFTGMKENG